MSKICVTGSGGFIASNFIRNSIWQKQPYEFISIDKINKSSVLNSIYSNKNHTFYIGDIADEHFINVVFEYERPDIIINFAAETSVDAALVNPNAFIHSNVLGTQVLVNASVKWGVKKFILISTDEIYGQLKDADAPLWTEESPLDPRNLYSASKASSEFIVKSAGYSFGLNYCITRSSNNYGPRQTPDKLIPRVIKCILEGKPIPVYGQGLQMRDWLYVIDNCNAIMKVVEKGESGNVYNISANQEFSNIEIVQIICNMMKSGHNLITHIDDPRKSHDFRYGMNIDKIKALGWEPVYKLRESLGKVIEWYENNRYWIFK